MIYTTIADIRALDSYRYLVGDRDYSSCFRINGWIDKKLTCLANQFGASTLIPMVEIVEAFGLETAVYFLPNTEVVAKLLKQFAVWNAEQAVRNFEKLFPDDFRPKRDLEAAKQQADSPLNFVAACDAYQDVIFHGEHKETKDPLDVFPASNFKAACAAQAAYSARLFTAKQPNPLADVTAVIEYTQASFCEGEGKEVFLKQRQTEFLRLLGEVTP